MRTTHVFVAVDTRCVGKAGPETKAILRRVCTDEVDVRVSEESVDLQQQTRGKGVKKAIVSQQDAGCVIQKSEV